MFIRTLCKVKIFIFFYISTDGNTGSEFQLVIYIASIPEVL